MRKLFSAVAAILVFAIVFTVTASAATGDEVWSPTDGKYAFTYELSEAGLTSVEDGTMFGMLVLDEFDPEFEALEDSDIKYIDQVNSKDGSIEFKSFAPMSTTASKYYVYIGGGVLSGVTRIGELAVASEDSEEITLITSIDDKSYNYTGDYIKYPAEDYITSEVRAAGIGLKGIVYTGDNYNSDIAPTNAGTYTATVTYGGDGWANKVLTAKLTINKATAVEITDAAIANTYNAGEHADAAALRTAMNLPATVNVDFGGATPEAVTAVWGDAAEIWNVKGGVTYTYTATLSNDNVNVSTLPPYIATATVNAVNATIEGADVSKVISKNEAENATAESLGIPPMVGIKIGDDEPINVTPVWEEDIVDAVKLAAADVTSNNVVPVTVKLDKEDTLGDTYEYLTVDNDPAVSISISTKLEATIEGDFDIADAVYGDEPVITNTLTWKGKAPENEADTGNEFDIVYIVNGSESDTQPTAAGTYQAYAKVKDDDYFAKTELVEFIISPKPITYNIDSKEMDYSDAAPDFSGSFAKALVDGDTVADFTIAYKVKTIADEPADVTDVTKAAVDTYTLTADVTNANYNVTVVDGTLKINKKSIENVTPVIDGDVKAGVELVADMGIADIFAYTWKIGDDVVSTEGTYTVKIADSNKTITLTANATGAANYTGVSKVASATVEKYEITGSLTFDPDVLPEGDAKGLVITAIPATEVPDEGYDIVWIVDGTATTVTGATYTISEADYGKTISAKLVGKGDYKGEVTTEDFVDVPAIAPSNVVITTETTKNTITVTVTADANGAAITEYVLTLTDSEENVIEEKTVESVEGVGTYTFEGLDSKTTYTITVVAVNGAGRAEPVTVTATTKAAGGTASPVTGGATTPTKPSTPPATETPSTGETETPSTGETETPATPETTITVPEADVVVESKTETATVPAADLADASVVAATVTTESGAKVDVTVDVADKAVDSLTVSADKANAEVTGKAADGIVGDAIEVKVDAKSGDTAVAVEATIAIDVEAQAYAYAVDELGNTVRLESAYDAETGKLLVAGVADGTVVAVSTTAPVDFADTADRWSDKEVKRAVDLGIVNGRSADAYAPAELLTRSETNKLKKNLAEVLKLELTVNADVKIDTDPSHWAYEADLWAAQTGITSGTGKTEDGTVVISGGDNVVRQDYLTLLARMIKLAIGDVTIEGTGVEFADAEHVADYAADSINLLSSIGILKGSEGADGVYANPKANITREEAAALSNRAYEFVKVLKTAK